MVDMAHFAGLVAGGVHPSPLPHAHVVTTTTHKTLRGPRGGMILSNDEEIGKKINSAVFPGLAGRAADACHRRQGGGASARRCSRSSSAYAQRRRRERARRWPRRWSRRGLDIVSGGTDTHLMLVDLRPKKLTGKAAEQSLERAGITCNKNGIPFDPEKPTVTSGIRLGTPAGTTRGFGAGRVPPGRRADRATCSTGWPPAIPATTPRSRQAVRAKVAELCRRFPIYPGL